MFEALVIRIYCSKRTERYFSYSIVVDFITRVSVSYTLLPFHWWWNPARLGSLYTFIPWMGNRCCHSRRVATKFATRFFIDRFQRFNSFRHFAVNVALQRIPIVCLLIKHVALIVLTFSVSFYVLQSRRWNISWIELNT